MHKIIILILFVAPTAWSNIWDVLEPRKTKPLASTDCTLNLAREFPNEPIVAINGQNKFIYPTTKDTYNNILTISENQQVIVACLGIGNEIIKDGVVNVGQNLKLTCSAGTLKDANKKDYNQHTLNCTGPVESTAKQSTNICGGAKTLKKCGNPNRKTPTLSIDVGFQLDANHFIKQFCVCFDKVTKSPVLSHYVITPEMVYSVPTSSVIRPSFTEDTFYGFTCDTLYKNQQENINNLLGLPSPTTNPTYISPNKGNGIELTRGHLVPYASFVYATQKKATNHYVNSAPQWHFFNDGNWSEVETGVRELAKAKSCHFDVYTGVSDTIPAQILTKNLYLKTNPPMAMPVPQFYWKLVHDSVKKQAVVFVGHNNPHEKFENTGLPFCTIVKNQITWVTWRKENNKPKDGGFTTACEYDNNIKQQFPDMPIVDASGGIIVDPPTTTSTPTVTTSSKYTHK